MKEKEHSETSVLPLTFSNFVYMDIATGPTIIISPSTHMNQSHEKMRQNSNGFSVGRA